MKTSNQRSRMVHQFSSRAMVQAEHNAEPATYRWKRFNAQEIDTSAMEHARSAREEACTRNTSKKLLVENFYRNVRHRVLVRERRKLQCLRQRELKLLERQRAIVERGRCEAEAEHRKASVVIEEALPQVLESVQLAKDILWSSGAEEEPGPSATQSTDFLYPEYEECENPFTLVESAIECDEPRNEDCLMPEAEKWALQREEEKAVYVLRRKVEMERERTHVHVMQEAFLRRKEERRQAAERAKLLVIAQQNAERLAHLEKERSELASLQQRALEEKRRRTAKERKAEVTRRRYNEALNEELIQKLRKVAPELPAICSCGASPLQSEPWKQCAMNCVYYNNPDAYKRALFALLQSINAF